MIEGETILSGAPKTCPECGVTVLWQICTSAAGHYVGTMCDCGPYTRESHYMQPDDARAAFDRWLCGDYVRARGIIGA